MQFERGAFAKSDPSTTRKASAKKTFGEGRMEGKQRKSCPKRQKQ